MSSTTFGTGMSADKHPLLVESGQTVSSRRWAIAFVTVLAMHVALGVFLLAKAREVLDGIPSDAINVEIIPDPSLETEKPDEIAGQKAVESAQPTNEKTQADDPEPPAPDAAPPTELKKEPAASADLTAPPAPVDAQAALTPVEKPRPPDPKPPVEEKKPDSEKSEQERQTAPSRASTGSAAQLSGGRRPSAVAQATWKGEINLHLVHLRRYPQEARSRGWQGIARVKVTIDDNGHVIDHELVKSSGQRLLDGEAMELMQRSDPFPKPPAGMPTPVTMTVPVNFAIR